MTAITIRLKLAILSVHGLDDYQLQYEWGITDIKDVGRNDILITFASRSAVISFAEACDSRADPNAGWVTIAPWHRRSARVASKTVQTWLAQNPDSSSIL